MLTQPIDVSEFEVAQKLEQRLKRKLGEKLPRASKPQCDEYRLSLDLSQQRVELATLTHFERLGWQVFYSENALLNGLLGLTFWPAFFAPVEGAFINAYQHRPLDLYHDDFAHKRAAEIEQAFTQLLTGDNAFILQRFHEKQGIANPLVQWSALSESLLLHALESIPRESLVALFKIQLSDLKLYRNGMPDLIAFKDGEYQWIEVKGPGDKLQDNQWRWIHHFKQLAIPFAVCYVEHQAAEAD